MERRTVAHMMETVSTFSGIRRLIIALTAVPYFDHLTLGWTGFMPNSKLIDCKNFKNCSKPLLVGQRMLVAPAQNASYRAACNYKVRNLSDNYRWSLPTATSPRVWVVHRACYDNTINETTGSGNRQLSNKIMILY